jgi:hypothetical protein
MFSWISSRLAESAQEPDAGFASTSQPPPNSPRQNAQEEQPCDEGHKGSSTEPQLETATAAGDVGPGSPSAWPPAMDENGFKAGSNELNSNGVQEIRTTFQEEPSPSNEAALQSTAETPSEDPGSSSSKESVVATTPARSLEGSAAPDDWSQVLPTPNTSLILFLCQPSHVVI